MSNCLGPGSTWKLSGADTLRRTQVARDIRSQYTIEYTPTDTAMDGTFRQIKVVAKAPGNPTVRTRSGYYATPDQAGRTGPADKGPASK